MAETVANFPIEHFIEWSVSRIYGSTRATA
jgi:hypothetical protein